MVVVVVVVGFFFSQVRMRRKSLFSDPNLFFLFVSSPKHPRPLAEPVGPLHLLPARVVQVAVEEQAVVGLGCLLSL